MHCCMERAQYSVYSTNRSESTASEIVHALLRGDAASGVTCGRAVGGGRRTERVVIAKTKRKVKS